MEHHLLYFHANVGTVVMLTKTDFYITADYEQSK